jgi:SAM-dependent methyltransferase
MHRGVTSQTLKGLRRIPAYWSAASAFERIVAGHTGLLMNKWKHYFDVYDRHLTRFRNRDISVLEIGVSGGGSLEILRRYLGPKARIVGIDINPECKGYETPGTKVVIGSQGDPAFLEKIAAEFGPFDIVIDDGSHIYEHQLTTFRTLFGHIRADGIYACEDLCTSYWHEEFGGGVRKPGTFMEFLKELIDELNAWYWRDNVEKEPDAFARTVHGMHFYPALVVIEKRIVQKPVITPVGSTRGNRRAPESTHS